MACSAGLYWFHSLFCGCLFSVVVQVDNAIDEKYAIQWLLLPPSSSSQLEVDHDKAEYCAHSLSLNSWLAIMWCNQIAGRNQSIYTLLYFSQESIHTLTWWQETWVLFSSSPLSAIFNPFCFFSSSRQKIASSMIQISTCIKLLN